MSDIVSIELLFDSATESAVRDDWDRLAEAGLSSLGAHRAPSNRPHLTLLVRPELHVEHFAEAVARLPLAITLGAPVVFVHGDRAVLARQVVPSAELLALHRAVHETAGRGPDARHTVPGAWTPPSRWPAACRSPRWRKHCICSAPRSADAAKRCGAGTRHPPLSRSSGRRRPARCR